MKVRFQQVGRSKMSWEAELPELSEPQLYQEVKSRRALLSDNITFIYDKAVNEGTIYVGWGRKVGTFSVIA